MKMSAQTETYGLRIRAMRTDWHDEREQLDEQMDGRTGDHEDVTSYTGLFNANCVDQKFKNKHPRLGR